MTKRKIRLSLTLSLVLILLCAALVPSIEVIITSFPEILLGQVVLARETKPLSPRAYQSAEFVLKEVALSEVEQAVYIALHEDVLFWDPQYVGFSRTELNGDEILSIWQLLSEGHLFYRTPDGESCKCIVHDPRGEPKLEACADGEGYLDRYVAYKWDAEQNRTVGVLQFTLSGDRLAEIRVYRTAHGLAYTPYETGGEWWLDGLTAPSPLLEEISTRVTVPSILVLWPEMTAARANTRAARIIGNKYKPALEFIQNSSAVRDLFGDIQEMRPAAGSNRYSSWMDSTSVFLTFRVLGSRGEGAVIIQGYDCFDLQMVFKGIPVDDGSSYICP